MNMDIHMCLQYSLFLMQIERRLFEILILNAVCTQNIPSVCIGLI